MASFGAADFIAQGLLHTSCSAGLQCWCAAHFLQCWPAVLVCCGPHLNRVMAGFSAAEGVGS